MPEPEPTDRFTSPYHLFQLMEVDPVFRADPHARWREVAAACPVSRDDAMRSLLAVGHADVRAVLADPTKFRDLRVKSPDHPGIPIIFANDAEVSGTLAADFPGEQVTRSRTMLFLDDPDHARIRGLFHKHFQPRMVAYRPRIEAVVDQALDRLDGREAFDAVADYAIGIPVRVIAEVLGVAYDDFERFKAWSDAVIAAFNPQRDEAERRAMIEATTGLVRYAAGLVRDRRATPRDDFVSALVAEQAGGYPITDFEIADNLVTLLVAGHLTTTDLIGNGVWLLLSHPDQRAKLAADPRLWPGAVEEVLRYEPPTTRTARVVVEDGTVGACPARAGDLVGVSLQAANRDPAAFPDPDRFDVARKANRHVTFGGGAHTCLGASLARLEGQIALSRLFERFPALRLADPDAGPAWRVTPFFRGLATLPVLAG